MAKPPRQADGRAHELTQRLRPVVQTLREELEARLTTSPPEQDGRALHGPDGVELGVEHARRLDAILTMLFDEASAVTPVSDMALVAMGS